MDIERKKLMNYKTILTEVDGKVATITLNRPEVLNALNDQLMDELGEALLKFDADDNIGCIILTGSEKAFAAGADITAMAKSPVIARMAYSGGANPLAKRASKGDPTIRTRPPIRPPIADAVIAMPMASDARPFWAIG